MVGHTDRETPRVEVTVGTVDGAAGDVEFTTPDRLETGTVVRVRLPLEPDSE